MSRECQQVARTSDPVELLLARIARRAFVGSLLSAWGSACAALDATPVVGELAQQAGPEVQAADAGMVAPRSPSACFFGGRYFRGEAGRLRPAETYDYVALRDAIFNIQSRLVPEDGGFEAAAWTSTNFELASATGEACATATTPECNAKIARHPQPKVKLCGNDSVCLERSIVTTRGDEVRRWAGRDDMLAVLGPIDTIDEASLVLNYTGRMIPCVALVAAVQNADGAFEVETIPASVPNCTGFSVIDRVRVSPQGEVSLLSSRPAGSLGYGTCSGRKPAQLVLAPTAAGASGLGRYLAEMAQLEDASVIAFAILADELEAHGAPAELVARALAARDDEVSHAATMAALARARGGLPVLATAPTQALRALEEVALENAVEGCVRETYGALIGAHQAAYASDLGVRRAMAGIAADEARHAALSHAVHAWIMPRLDASARARIEAAQRAAIDELEQACAAELDETTRVAAGLPGADRAVALVDELARTLWLPALAA